ncbi:NAD(P)/FAD-dependent oxidoreductase, partial [uncultured Aeromicrobium sp.]|uniref:phytoene desaturase family protein n=1 Tax=uncultured Aeromicrobium sp. TaxID=337820 RepID=UPI0025D959CE
MTRVDAIVIGSGPNGLVGANRLADAGWSVLVLEQQPTFGGAVRHDTQVYEGFRHDTFSAFYPFAAASPVLHSLDLERWGVRWRHAPAVLGHPFPDGSWALQVRDREHTAAGFERAQPGDGEEWLRLCALWDEVGEHLIGALLSPLPPVRHGLGLAAKLPKTGGLDLVKLLLTPAAELGRGRLQGEHPRILLAGNAGHSDIPLHAPGSGAMGLLMTMLGQTVGFPVPEGGAGELSAALVRRLEARGGIVRCNAEVTHIDVDRGRVTGVRTADGERLSTEVVLA